MDNFCDLKDFFIYLFVNCDIRFFMNKLRQILQKTLPSTCFPAAAATACATDELFKWFELNGLNWGKTAAVVAVGDANCEPKVSVGPNDWTKVKI